MEISLRFLTEFTGKLFFALKQYTSQAGSRFEVLGITISSRGGCDEVIASFSLSDEKTQKAVALGREMGGRRGGACSFTAEARLTAVFRPYRSHGQI